MKNEARVTIELGKNTYQIYGILQIDQWEFMIDRLTGKTGYMGDLGMTDDIGKSLKAKDIVPILKRLAKKHKMKGIYFEDTGFKNKDKIYADIRKQLKSFKWSD